MIYTRENLEQLADKINMEFFPKRLSTPSALDVYDLLEALGCEYEWKYISPDDTIMGMTFFADGYWYIWPKGHYSTGDKPNTEVFKKGTILINQRLLDSKSKKIACSEKFIVTHEAAHWIKDKSYFKNHPNNIMQTCYKNDFDITIWNNNMNELEIIERQANYLGAAIHMPRDILIETFFKVGRYKHIPDEPIMFMPYMKGWVAKIADMYGLNFNPVKYRLKDLNIISE